MPPEIRKPNQVQEKYLEELRRENKWLEALFICDACFHGGVHLREKKNAEGKVVEWIPIDLGPSYKIEKPEWVLEAERKWREEIREKVRKNPWPYGLNPNEVEYFRVHVGERGDKNALSDALETFKHVPTAELPPFLLVALAERARRKGVRHKRGARAKTMKPIRDLEWFGMIKALIDDGRGKSAAIFIVAKKLVIQDLIDSGTPQKNAIPTEADIEKKKSLLWKAYLELEDNVELDPQWGWVPKTLKYEPAK